MTKTQKIEILHKQVIKLDSLVEAQQLKIKKLETKLHKYELKYNSKTKPFEPIYA